MKFSTKSVSMFVSFALASAGVNAFSTSSKMAFVGNNIQNKNVAHLNSRVISSTSSHALSMSSTESTETFE